MVLGFNAGFAVCMHTFIVYIAVLSDRTTLCPKLLK